MEHNSLDCQVCLAVFKSFFDFKKHMRSKGHRQRMEEVFEKGAFRGSGFLPSIVVIDPLKHGIKHPIIGLSLLTVCFSPQLSTFFYLCHVCEEKCSPDKILFHLSSGDHSINYFNYRDPNVLSFSWLPSMDMRFILRPHITKEVNKRGPEQLQMLDLPVKLLNKCETSTYSEVMRFFSENDKLLKLLEAVKPKRTMIQTYQKDGNRKHSLLGMQHLVECISIGQTERRYFLCTLCKLTLAAHMIIKHVLSFDHIFCYFKAWHPSTLLPKECYNIYNDVFASIMLDLAKQAEEIQGQGTSNTDMKQVSLESDVFTSVKFSCYAEALKKLESITKENKESSLITHVKPGNKLEYRTASVCPTAAPSYKLHCQDCNMSFPTISRYLKHVFKWEHQQMLKKLFGEAERTHGYDQAGWKPHLALYTYLQESLKQKQPLVGLSLVVTCLSTQVQAEPIYVCFACKDSFSQSFLQQHLDTQKHLIQTLLYHNPAHIPFAWKHNLDVKAMRSAACEEEKKRGQNQILLKMLDVPSWIIEDLDPPSFSKVIQRLEPQHAVLKRHVPPCEMYSKLGQSQSLPQLGRQFLVMHNVCVEQQQFTAFLCLLCERRLSDDEGYAHLFKWEHVVTFLKHFHPGSLDASTENEETLLDLAKQAACIHPVSHVQVMHLDTPIWEPCTYRKAITILMSVKRRWGKGKLKPPIIANKKLVPREVDKSQVRENSLKNGSIMEASEKKTSQKSLDNSETTLKKISEKVGAEIINKSSKGSGENVVQGAIKETLPLSEKKSEERERVFSKAISEEIKVEVDEKCQTIKEEMEEPTKLMGKPSEEAPESCQDDGAETEKKGSKDVQTQLKNYTYQENGRKRLSSMSEESQDLCHNEHVEREMSHKRQRNVSKEDASCEEPEEISGGGQREVTTADKGEQDKSHQIDKVTSNWDQQAAQFWQDVKKKSLEPVIGLDALLECHGDQQDPIYLCECCSQKIPEKDIISHVAGFDHQKMYLMGVQKIPPRGIHWKKGRHLAALFEEDGCGVAKVVEMEVKNDSEDSEAQPSSVSAATYAVTENSSKTTEISPESNEDVRIIQHADDTNGSLTASRSGKDASSLHLSKSGTNTLCLHPDSTGTSSKAEITPNTTVGPLNRTTTSKIVGRPQTADTSDSTTAAKPMTATSTFTAKTSGSTPDTTKPTATVSKCKATTTTKLGKTTYKCTAAISSVPVTTAKSTAPTAICTASKFTAASTKVTGTAFTSCVTISKTTSSTRSATASKPADSRTGAASKVAATSHKAAPAPHAPFTVKREATCSTASGCKIKNCSENSETTLKTTESSQTLVTTTKMMKMPIKCEYTDASAKIVHMKSSLGSNADVAPHNYKISPPAAPHGNTPSSVKSEHKNPLAEPSHIPVSKTKSTESPPKVGLNNLIKVSCEGSRQVYCQLCSVRLMSSTHVSGFNHQYNYVKMKFPGWSVKQSVFAQELNKMVTQLAEAEKGVGSQKIETFAVNKDTYKELAALPEDRAIEKLKVMLRHRDMQVSSCSTDDTAEALGQQLAFASPYEASSPDDVVKVEEPYVCANDSESISTFDPTSDAYQETFENRRQQEKSDSELQDTQKEPEDTQKTSPSVSVGPDLVSAAAVSLTKEQQNSSRPSQEADKNVLKGSGCRIGSEQHSGSQVALIGEITQGPSHLSKYLRVKGLDTGPVIGRGCVWECRGISLKESSLKPFFLCESCNEMLFLNDICQHMVSPRHQLKCMEKLHPYYLSKFWKSEELLPERKWELLKDVSQKLSELERDSKMDAQGILLGHEAYVYVQTAPFSKALNIVQNIKKAKKLSIRHMPTRTPQQKDELIEDQQSREESFHKEVQSAPASETDKSSDNEARQTRKRILEEAATVGGSDGVKRRRILTPPDVSSVSTKANSVDPSYPGVGTCLSPQESYSLCMHPALRSLNQQQNPISKTQPDLQVTWAELSSDSPSSSTICPKASQTLSVVPRDEYPPTRKSTTVASVETLVRPSTSSPQIQDPLAAKCSQPNPELSSESPSVNPAVIPALLSYNDHAQSMLGHAIQIKPIPDYGCKSTNYNPHQIPQPQGNTDTTVGCQLPIKTITTDKPDQTNQLFMGGYNEQDHTVVNGGTLPASGDRHFSHMAYVTNGHSGRLSSEAAVVHKIPDTTLVYPRSLYPSGGYPTNGLYPRQIYPEQKGNRFSLPPFGQSLATPMHPRWLSLEMQQLMMQQQQLMMQQQQLIMQQQPQLEQVAMQQQPQPEQAAMQQQPQPEQAVMQQQRMMQEQAISSSRSRR